MVLELICKYWLKGHWFMLLEKIGLKQCFICHKLEDMAWNDLTL